MIIILINGPSGSGKDTIGELICQQACSDVHIEKFARPLKQAARLIYDIPLADWQVMDRQENKRVAHSQLLGKTPVEVQISLSEDYLKVQHGRNVFGRLLVARLRRCPAKQAYIITDSGFREEAEEVVKKYGAENVFLWRVHREGYNFNEDSRSYISLADLGVTEVNLINDMGIPALREHVIDLYKACSLCRENEGHASLEPDDSFYERRGAAIKHALMKRSEA